MVGIERGWRYVYYRGVMPPMEWGGGWRGGKEKLVLFILQINKIIMRDYA